MQPPILSLRQAIVQRVHGKTPDDLKDIIESSIDGTEQALPGLGVLFELIWKDTDDGLHAALVDALYHNLQATPPPLQTEK